MQCLKHRRTQKQAQRKPVTSLTSLMRKGKASGAKPDRPHWQEAVEERSGTRLGE